ncbi:MAG TPA: MFS transporter [Bacillota bacterium]
MDGEAEQSVKQLNRRRWMVWIPLAFAFCPLTFIALPATGVVADSLMRDFSITRAADIGRLASVYFYIYAVMQLPAGILADTFGPRRTVLLALTAATLGAVIFGLAANITMLYLDRVISSIGLGLIYICIVKIHAEWFRTREFTTMTGLAVVAGSTGFLLAATPLALMVDCFGWRNAFLTLTAYSLLVAVACWHWVKDHPTDLVLPTITAVEAWEGTVWHGGKPPVWALYPLSFGISLEVSGTNLNVACGKEVNPPAITGMVAGIINTGLGRILDQHWQGAVEQGVRVYPLAAFQSAFWFCAIVLLVGLFFTCLIKETRGVNIYSCSKQSSPVG